MTYYNEFYVKCQQCHKVDTTVRLTNSELKRYEHYQEKHPRTKIILNVFCESCDLKRQEQFFGVGSFANRLPLQKHWYKDVATFKYYNSKGIHQQLISVLTPDEFKKRQTHIYEVDHLAYIRRKKAKKRAQK